VKVLVDEMYPATVAEALRAAGAAVAGGYAVLTENVGDCEQIEDRVIYVERVESE